MTQTADDLRHALPAVTAGLELLRAPLTPYQITAAATLGLPNLDGTGYQHPVAVVLWPRQTGKTTLLMLLAMGRGKLLTDYRARYAAQTGHITSQRFREWIELIRKRPGWRTHYSTRRSDGTEDIVTRRTGSYLRAFPPIPGRLRSAALDLVIVDEAQEHDDDRVGQQLDADIQPTFDTRPRGQWIIAGTAGDTGSTYFRRHYDLARTGAPGYVLLEVGTWPEDADPDDPATWIAHHPGLRAGRTTLERLHQARSTLGPERFAREYGNRWAAQAAESLFPPGAWADCHRPDAGITGPISLALEIPPDRESAHILAAGQSTTHPDRIHVELVATQPIALATATAARLTKQHRTALTIDPHAAIVTHLHPLRMARVPLAQLTGNDVISASMGLYDAVRDRRLTHLDQPPLTAAMTTAARKKVGERWALARTAPGGSLAMGAALAVHAHATRSQHAPYIGS